MNFREILWRSKTYARMPLDWYESIQYDKGSFPSEKNAVQAPDTGVYPIYYKKCTGKRIETFHIFDLPFDVDTTFNWHKDYSSGKDASRKFSRLNSCHSGFLGEIKYIWELNRHQYLSALAFCSEGENITKHILASLHQWMLANPYLRGVNWTSGLELGLRIISWALIYPRIREDLSKEMDIQNQFLKMIYLHLYEIRRNFSQFSSANNHLIGEAAGLYVGAACFPFWKESFQWRQEAKEILEKEIVHQVYEDGINKEQAMGYHLFTLEFFLLVLIIGRSLGDRFNSSYLQRIEAMLVYLNSVATDSGDLPWWGDSDEGKAFLLSPEESILQVTMELGGYLFRKPEFLRFSKSVSCTSHALLSPNEIASFSIVKQSPPVSSKVKFFPQGGVAILENKDCSIRVLFDFGQLGYSSIAAHGHADALSLLFVLGNEYFLIDPGTYSYNSFPKWRSYFRGTSAHNTIRVDGQDQSLIGGKFLWRHKAKTKLIQWEPGDSRDSVEAAHYGYQRLEDPVIHQRRVVLEKTENQIIITDTLDCNQEHDVELFFHLHQGSTILNLDGNDVQIQFNEYKIMITVVNNQFHLEILQGSDSPIGGWRSACFHQKHPIPTLRFAGKVYRKTEIVTSITITK